MPEPLIDLAEVAALEERRQAQAIADVALESAPIAGGIMSRGEPGTWCNAAVGLGFAGPVEPAAITRLISWYEKNGIEPRVELCPFSHPSLRELLEQHRFSVRVFENTFFRLLSRDEMTAPIQPLPAEIEVRRVDSSDPAAVREYGVTVATGFSDGSPREADIKLMMRCALHPRTIAFTAHHKETCVGGGGLEVTGPPDNRISALFGLSILPNYRKRGIQQALIAARLNTAARCGARFATISSRPGVATERNVRRMGFQVAYTKVALTRAGPGLARVTEL